LGSLSRYLPDGDGASSIRQSQPHHAATSQKKNQKKVNAGQSATEQKGRIKRRKEPKESAPQRNALDPFFGL
jgi:hypothetical protein